MQQNTYCRNREQFRAPHPTVLFRYKFSSILSMHIEKLLKKSKYIMQILQYSGSSSVTLTFCMIWAILRVAQDDGDTCLISTKNRQTGWIYNNDFWLYLRNIWQGLPFNSISSLCSALFVYKVIIGYYWKCQCITDRCLHPFGWKRYRKATTSLDISSLSAVRRRSRLSSFKFKFVDICRCISHPLRAVAGVHGAPGLPLRDGLGPVQQRGANRAVENLSPVPRWGSNMY